MRLALLLLGVVALSGCGDKSSAPAAGGTNSSGTNASVLTAPVDYLRAVGDSKQKAQGTLDTTSIDKAAELFNVDKGRYPNSIDEMVKEKYLPTTPSAPYGTKLQYDSKSGKSSVVRE